MYRKFFIDLYTKNNFPFDEAKSEVDLILDILFNYGYKDFVLGKKLEDWQSAKVERVVKERISTHRPIQQILGQAYFYGRKFFVNENTLIPRPETELLVKKALDLCKDSENVSVLDIGTGTGCIPITLAMENKNITADSVDISTGAIEIAEKNALFHNVYERVHFYKSDLFERVEKRYNIITSNPPYIPLKDKENLQNEVKNYDPALALFTKDEQGIEFYEKILDKSEDYLLEGGYIVFELGINQAELVQEMMKKLEYKNIEIIKDYNSIARVISAKK